MQEPKKSKSSKNSKAQQVPDLVVMEQLAKCIVESLGDSLEDVQEPFERYAHQLKIRVYQDDKNFCKRFIQGYRVLWDYLLSK